MINVEQIKEKISDAIQYSGYTQTEIANAIGVSQTMISAYLKKRKTPQIETLANLCQFLDLYPNQEKALLLFLIEYKQKREGRIISLYKQLCPCLAFLKRYRDQAEY